MDGRRHRPRGQARAGQGRGDALRGDADPSRNGSAGARSGGWPARSAPTSPNGRRSATAAASTHSGARSGAVDPRERASSTRTGARSSTCTSAARRGRERTGASCAKGIRRPLPLRVRALTDTARVRASSLYFISAARRCRGGSALAAAGLEAVDLDLGAADHEVGVGARAVDAHRLQLAVAGTARPGRSAFGHAVP